MPENQLLFWSELKEKYSFSIQHKIVRGGETRFFSVKNGLEFVDPSGLVAIHDGVRPLVSNDTIRRCFESADKYGNCIPVISPSDSLRMITQEGNRPVDRMQFKQVQTPQVFKSELIKKAYQQEYQPDFTDDATVLERIGEKINMVEGNRENIKITNPQDMIIAQGLFTLTI